MTIDSAVVATIFVSGLITSIATPLLVYVNQNNAKRAAVKAEEVKTALAQTDSTVARSLAAIVTTGNDTHMLVNSQYGEALQSSALAYRALANLTKDPETEKAALDAEEKLAKHREKQRALDSQITEERR